MIKNFAKDYQIDSEELNGFYIGVVEDNNDPLKQNRVKVRIFGVHTEINTKYDIDGILTEELPWANPINNNIEGSISGNGFWNVPLNGSHVIIFFLNGNILSPCYLGCISGKYLEKPNSKTGFSDPNEIYPTDNYINEPDVHKLARDVSENTIVDTKNSNLESSIPIAFSGNWNEFESAYNGVYPHNSVLKFHGGLTLEFDSTPNNERFHLYHPSNTYIEIDKLGNIVIRNNYNKQEIVEKSKYEYIKEQSYETIEQDKHIKLNANLNEEITENETVQIHGNKDITIDGNEERLISGNQSITIEGNQDVNINGNCNITVGGNSTINTSGDTTITSGGNITMTGSEVQIN